MRQEIPDLQTAMVSYIEARSKLIEKRKHRGFWPVKGQKGGKKFGGEGRKGPSGKGGLLARIAETDCHIWETWALESGMPG